ncbi:hypothetical protein [Roseovarius sp. MMSF_3281]|uniref:hypothetical protein n=1 Tax=Roseovarius sp. MMSF_3281 TaxID=3046694 RepID=UPI00273E2344|nr:hypothetical protein [Roseovarius sp. MMSF_3281]
MQHVTTPLELTAAAWRMAGYVVETNLRVAQVFGQAAFQANPFSTGVQVDANALTAKPVPAKKPKAAAPKSRPATASPAPEAKPAKPLSPKSAKSQKTKSVASKVPDAPVDKPARPRAPSKPPAMPESTGTRLKKPKTPLN